MTERRPHVSSSEDSDPHRDSSGTPPDPRGTRGLRVRTRAPARNPVSGAMLTDRATERSPTQVSNTFEELAL